jgi:hypothetical protein
MDDTGNAYGILLAKSEIGDLEGICILVKMNLERKRK